MFPKRKIKIPSILYKILGFLLVCSLMEKPSFSSGIETINSNKVLEISELHKEMNDLLSKLKEQDEEIKNLKSEVKQTKLSHLKNAAIRAKILNDLKSIDLTKFPALSLNENGSIIILLDSAFIYRKSRFVLKKSFQKQFREFLPFYAKILFKHDHSDSSIIREINIAGYASPSYKKKYVSLDSFPHSAYSFNLKVSLDRANEINKFIASNSSGDFPFKSMLRNKLAVTGFSFLKPIQNEAEVDEPKKSGSCGPYDCRKSKRIEIQFNLSK